jgi:hypothetical protein
MTKEEWELMEYLWLLGLQHPDELWKWVYHVCYIKDWSKYCPVCWKDMSLDDTKARVDHIAKHKKRGAGWIE